MPVLLIPRCILYQSSINMCILYQIPVSTRYSYCCGTKYMDAGHSRKLTTGTYSSSSNSNINSRAYRYRSDTHVKTCRNRYIIHTRFPSGTCLLGEWRKNASKTIQHAIDTAVSYTHIRYIYHAVMKYLHITTIHLDVYSRRLF